MFIEHSVCLIHFSDHFITTRSPIQLQRMSIEGGVCFSKQRFKLSQRKSKHAYTVFWPDV